MNNNIEIIESILDDNFDSEIRPLKYEVKYFKDYQVQVGILFNNDELDNYDLGIFSKLIRPIDKGEVPFNQWSNYQHDLRSKYKFFHRMTQNIDILKRIYDLTQLKVVECHVYRGIIRLRFQKYVELTNIKK